MNTMQVNGFKVVTFEVYLMFYLKNRRSQCALHTTQELSHNCFFFLFFKTASITHTLIDPCTHGAMIAMTDSFVVMPP